MNNITNPVIVTVRNNENLPKYLRDSCDDRVGGEDHSNDNYRICLLIT